MTRILVALVGAESFFLPDIKVYCSSDLSKASDVYCDTNKKKVLGVNLYIVTNLCSLERSIHFDRIKRPKFGKESDERGFEIIALLGRSGEEYIRLGTGLLCGVYSFLYYNCRSGSSWFLCGLSTCIS